jgi:hypothetical protein
MFRKLSAAPTNPQPAAAARSFDVADLYRGPAAESGGATESLALHEKLRQAYFWIVNTAIISPHYDIEYNDKPPLSYVLGDSRGKLTLPSAQSAGGARVRSHRAVRAGFPLRPGWNPPRSPVPRRPASLLRRRAASQGYIPYVLVTGAVENRVSAVRSALSSVCRSSGIIRHGHTRSPIRMMEPVLDSGRSAPHQTFPQ